MTTATAGPGLRERKKRRTRQLLADTAAALFAERGYAAVSVLDVARTAGVSEQTVYNYFPTKERLVFDLDDEGEARLAAMVRERAAGVTPAAALRPALQAVVDGVAARGADFTRGGMIYLTAVTPALHLGCLAMTEQFGRVLAAALLDGPEPPPGPTEATLRGRALGGLVQLTFDEIGSRLVAATVGDDLRSQVTAVLDAATADLDRWI